MPDLSSAGKWLFLFGLLLVFLGGLLWLAGRVGFPLGKFPGDIHFQFGSFTCFFPLVSSIIISIVLTIAINLILRWLSK